MRFSDSIHIVLFFSEPAFVCFLVRCEYLCGSGVKHNGSWGSLTFPLALKITQIQTFWFHGKGHTNLQEIPESEYMYGLARFFNYG